MRISKYCVLALVCVALTATCFAQCPKRPIPGSEVTDALAISSSNGVVQANFNFRNGIDLSGNTSYCFAYQGIESPTLRLNPGDSISINLQNQLTIGQGTSHTHHGTSIDPCNGIMTGASTNIHFHGLNVRPVCHQDEVIHMLVNPGDPVFHYQIKVPANEPPGLYWYHPHPHSLTAIQILGGASGALIVEGIEKIKPEVAGLPERVLVVRQQMSSGVDLDAGSLTLNYVPATYPETLAPMITMNPLEKQFWRVVNAAANTFLNLQVQINGVPEDLQLISLDAVPLKTDITTKTIHIPPAGRAEFIMTGPPAGAPTTFMTIGQDTGSDGDSNPPQLLAKIITSSTGATKTATIPAASDTMSPRRFADLLAQQPRTVRHLSLTEDLSDMNNPLFYITVQGQTPKIYDPNDPPAIVTKQGAVEDWLIRNDSKEVHAFHMHQIHFALIEKNGVPVPTQFVQDTVLIDAWDGVSAVHPSVKVRMDFRYKESVGTFLYHCHILDHEDGGMMAKIQVDPAN